MSKKISEMFDDFSELVKLEEGNNQKEYIDHLEILKTLKKISIDIEELKKVVVG